MVPITDAPKNPNVVKKGEKGQAHANIAEFCVLQKIWSLYKKLNFSQYSEEIPKKNAVEVF